MYQDIYIVLRYVRPFPVLKFGQIVRFGKLCVRETIAPVRPKFFLNRLEGISYFEIGIGIGKIFYRGEDYRRRGCASQQDHSEKDI